MNNVCLEGKGRGRLIEERVGVEVVGRVVENGEKKRRLTKREIVDEYQRVVPIDIFDVDDFKTWDLEQKHFLFEIILFCCEESDEKKDFLYGFNIFQQLVLSRFDENFDDYGKLIFHYIPILDYLLNAQDLGCKEVGFEIKSS